MHKESILNKKVPKLSIITPVYNCESYLEETIKSVLLYTKGIAFEYIVVNDGSTDSTTKIISKYQNSLIVLNQENSGQAKSICNALSVAKGQYSLVVNADDPLITADLFLDSFLVLDSNPSIVGTYPDWKIVDAKGYELKVKRVKDYSIDELAGKSNCLIGPGGIFRTNVAKKVHGWSSTYKYVPDFDFWLKLSSHGNFQHIPSVQAVWRQHTKSISIRSRGLQMANERIRVIDEYLLRNPGLSIKFRNKCTAHSYVNAAVLAYFDKKVRAKKLIFQSFLLYPRIILEVNIKITLFSLALPISRYLISLFNRLRKLQLEIFQKRSNL